MTARVLLRELEERGVKLTVELVARGPSGAVTPTLAEQIRDRKSELLRELQAGEGRTITPLPEPLARLIGAAISNYLNRPGILPSGIVPNLGDYVLACAAQYAAGVDPERQLQALWMARGAWAT